MMTQCCVPQCKHGNKNKQYKEISLHAFPKEEEVKKQWLKNIKLTDFQDDQQRKVCSAHFRPEDYKFCEKAGIIILKPDAVPTVFDWSTEKSSEESKNRFIVMDDVQDEDSVGRAISTENMMSFPGKQDQIENMFIMSCETEGGNDVNNISQTKNDEKQLNDMLGRLTSVLTGEAEAEKPPVASRGVSNRNKLMSVLTGEVPPASSRGARNKLMSVLTGEGELEKPPATLRGARNKLSDSVSSNNSPNSSDSCDMEDSPYKDTSDCDEIADSSKSSSLSSFPLSLVMNHPTFQLKLPLLSSSVDPFDFDIVHSVFDEVGIMTNQSFTFKHPLTDKNVTVTPASKNIVKELKSKLEKSQKKTIKWTKSSNTKYGKENVRINISDSIKKDLILQNCEDSDYIMQNKSKFSNMDFYTLPPGKILLGRTSNGEWLIGSQKSQCMNKRKFSSRGDGNSDADVLNESCNGRKTISNEDTPAVRTTRNSYDTSKEHREGQSLQAAHTGNFLNETSSEFSKDNSAERYQKGESSQQPLEQESVSMATNEPRPVMLLRNNQNLLHISKNQSEIGNSYSLPSEDNFQSDSEMKVKEEPVDTSFDIELNESTTLQAENSSSPVVQFPVLTQFGQKDDDSSENNMCKSGQKRKGDDDTESPSSSKFILINPVGTDQSTSQSGSQVSAPTPPSEMVQVFQLLLKPNVRDYMMKFCEHFGKDQNKVPDVQNREGPYEEASDCPSSSLLQTDRAINGFDSTGNTHIKLMPNSDITVRQDELSIVIRKAQKKDNPGFLLMRKLMLMLFTKKELAESRGQGLAMAKSKDGNFRQPLDQTKVKVAKEILPSEHTETSVNVSFPEVSVEGVAGETNFRCGLCDKEYKTKDSLQRHMKSHGDNGRLFCASCTQYFNTESDLEQHNAKTHIANHLCTVCGKTFNRKSSLKQHMLLHIEDKSKIPGLHWCPYESCDKSFINIRKFEDHLNIHTKQLPYTCTSCQKKFSSRCRKVEHEKVCSGKVEFKCETCFAIFTDSSSLSRHKQSQHLQHQYICPCGKIYKYYSSLYKHKKSEGH